MEEPTDATEWLARLIEMAEEIDTDTISKANAGNAAAKATVEAWAVEIQAALIFLLGYSNALRADGEALLATINAVMETLQAILIALGIALILKKFRKKDKSKAFLEIVISEKDAKDIAGDKAKAIPSRPDADKDQESAFLFLRMQWMLHYLITLFQAVSLQEEMDLEEGEEMVWVSRKDAKVCSICKYMDGKESVNGDFLPVLLKGFPTYIPYVPIMPFPHAHPRCRCIAKPKRSKAPDIYTKEQLSGKGESDTTK